jgi:phage-related protein
VDDVITLFVDMNKKGFERGCSELKGAITSLSKTAGKMGSSIKSAIPAILGVGSAYQIISKAVSTFMSQNQQLSRQMTAVWTALGNLLGPIITQVVSWITMAVSYLLSFLKVLGVTGKTASQLSKQAKQSGADLKRTIASFDELNVLQENQTASLPDLELPDWAKDLAELFKSGNFGEAGRLLAAKLNQMVDDIDWDGIGSKLAYGFKGAIDFIGNVIRDFDFHKLGQKFAILVNKILNIDSSSENTWKNLGEILMSKFTIPFDLLTGFLEDIDSAALAKAISDTLIGAIEAASDSIATADWKKIAENIGKFFENIDWEGIADAIWEAFTESLSAASDFYEGLPDWLQDVAVGVAAIVTASKGIEIFNSFATSIEAIKNLDAVGLFGKLGEVIAIVTSGAGNLHEAINLVFGPGSVIAGIAAVVAGAIMAFTNFFDMLKDGFSWMKEILMVIGVAIAAVGAIILGVPALVAGVIAAIVAAVATAVVLIKEHWEEIKQWFSDACKAIGDFFSKMWSSITEAASKTGENVRNFMSKCIDSIKVAWTSFKGFMATLWDGIVGLAKKAVNGVISVINGMIRSVTNGINSLFRLLSFSIDLPGGGSIGLSLPQVTAPQIPYLAKGGILKKGQVGLLEGDGAEAVVPLEKNTEWISKMADAFLDSVNKGNHSLTGNASILSALDSISDRVSYRSPAIAQGTIAPYSVVTASGNTNSNEDNSDVVEAIMALMEKLDDILYLLDNIQFVADFGDSIRALARKISKEQKKERISEGR